MVVQSYYVFSLAANSTKSVVNELTDWSYLNAFPYKLNKKITFNSRIVNQLFCWMLKKWNACLRWLALELKFNRFSKCEGRPSKSFLRMKWWNTLLVFWMQKQKRWWFLDKIWWLSVFLLEFSFKVPRKKGHGLNWVKLLCSSCSNLP